MANLLADENFAFSVVEELRLLGHDVMTVHEAGQRGTTDAEVLNWATSAGRAVLTFNRRDFVRLHSRMSSHAGIVVCTDDEARRLADRIHQAIVTLATLNNQLVRVNRPP
jgi:predicted nuclease of predicted toxin-antitoxin system